MNSEEIKASLWDLLHRKKINVTPAGMLPSYMQVEIELKNGPDIAFESDGMVINPMSEDKIKITIHGDPGEIILTRKDVKGVERQKIFREPFDWSTICFYIFIDWPAEEDQPKEPPKKEQLGLF